MSSCRKAFHYKIDSSRNTSSNSILVVVVRNLYKFNVNAETYAKLLALNVSVKNKTSVNIVAEMSNKCERYVVVGSGNPNFTLDYDPYQTNDMQVAQYENNLAALNIKYERVNVIQIFNSDIIDSFSHSLYLLDLLNKNKIKVKLIISGESSLKLPLEECPCVAGGYAENSAGLFIVVADHQIQNAIDTLQNVDFANQE